MIVCLKYLLVISVIFKESTNKSFVRKCKISELEILWSLELFFSDWKIREEHWEIKIVFNKYGSDHTIKITLTTWWEV